MALLKPKMAEWVIYQGDDASELAFLKRRVNAAQNALDAVLEAAENATARAGGDDGSRATLEAARDAAQADLDAAIDAAAERAVTVQLWAIGRRRFRELLAAFPPRMVEIPGEDDKPPRSVIHEDDAGWNVNTAAFPDALLGFWDDADGQADEPVTTVYVDGIDTREALQAFLDDDVSDGDFDEMWQLAYFANANPSADPSRFRSSVDSQTSTGTDA